jgi:hypothetical protein
MVKCGVLFEVRAELLHIIICALHDVAVSVCPSVRIIELDNRWTDLDEIWYVRYATGFYRKIILLNFVSSVIPTWRTNELVR